MRVVGATEYALVFYRDKLPKFRNGAKVDEEGKTIRGTGKMILTGSVGRKTEKIFRKFIQHKSL